MPYSSPSPFLLSFSLLVSLPILFFLAPRILPPRILPDDPDDISLLRRASHSLPSSKTRLGSTKTAPKIAFLFLTNSDLHFSPLWQLFFSQTTPNLFNIYIHADPLQPFTNPGGVFADRLIQSKRTHRASPSLISAARRLLATALLDDSSNLLFALISQHCVPIHSFKYVYSSLIENGVRRGRYKSDIEILSNEPKLWERYTARGRYSMLPEVPFNKFRVGSQFFILTRKHATIVVSDKKLWKKFRLPCLRADSCYPEEHYFPTLLSMQDLDGCSGYSLTRVNWTGSTHGHPYTYRPGEVSAELIYKLRDSNSTYSYLFARKFSPDCLKRLMKLAKNVIFRD